MVSSGLVQDIYDPISPDFVIIMFMYYLRMVAH